MVREAGEVCDHVAARVRDLLSVDDVRDAVVVRIVVDGVEVGTRPPAAEIVAGAGGGFDGADVGVRLHEERADVGGAGALGEGGAEAEEVRLHVDGPHGDRVAAVLLRAVLLEERVVHLQERLLGDALCGVGENLRRFRIGSMAIVFPAAEVFAAGVPEGGGDVAHADLHRMRLVVEGHEAPADDAHGGVGVLGGLGFEELHEARVLVEGHDEIVGVARLAVGEGDGVRECKAVARDASGPDEFEWGGGGVQLALGHVQAVHGGVGVRVHHVPALEHTHEVAVRVHDVRRDGRFEKRFAILHDLHVHHFVGTVHVPVGERLHRLRPFDGRRMVVEVIEPARRHEVAVGVHDGIDGESGRRKPERRHGAPVGIVREAVAGRRQLLHRAVV